MSEAIYTIRISEAICAAMALDDTNLIKEMGLPVDGFKSIANGVKFTGTLAEIERLADYMKRSDGWDLPPQTIANCNKRAAQIMAFVRETRAGKDLP